MVKWFPNTLMKTRFYRDGTVGAQRSKGSKYQTMLAKHSELLPNEKAIGKFIIPQQCKETKCLN